MQRIGFIVLPGFQMLSVTALSVFELANWEIGEPVYDVHLLSETGGSIRSSIGIGVTTEPFDDTNFDTLMVGGSAVVSAGMTAGIDLALAMIEKDLSAEVARAVARQLVVYHRRAGGQSQFSALLELEPKSDRIQRALAYAKRNLDTPLTVGQLAEAAHLSPRQFSRAFHAETGQSPAKAVENLRLEAARLMMEQSRHPIEVIARQTGFADRDRMRRAFLRAFGQPPQVIRRNARADVAA